MYFLNVSDHHAALARAALNGNRKLLTGATPRKPVCGADREVVGERQEYPILPAAGWNILTPVYDFLCSAVGLGKRFKRWLIELANVEPHDRVLDIGCGTGTLAVLLAVMFPATQISAVDPDPRAVDIARRKARKHGVKLAFYKARAESIPFADASFDKVFSTLMLHHIPDEQKLAVLREIHRTLRPGGRLILADFESSASWLFWGKDRSRQKLQRWLSDAGFEIAHLGHRRGVHVFEGQHAMTATAT